LPRRSVTREGGSIVEARVAAITTLLFLVLLLGMSGLLVELALLAHYEDLNQRIPLGLLGAGIVVLLVDRVSPAAWTRHAIQFVMLFFIAAGLLGMYLHFAGSRAFQLEMDPEMRGMTLVWHVLQAKSPPTLSPGTMVQMGILGLGYAYLRK
jgi:hypothetical protein